MSHLRIIMPTVEYLLAMKCIAARFPCYTTKGDRDDIAFLLNLLGLTEPESVFKIVGKFYPPERFLPKIHFLIRELLQRRGGGAEPPNRHAPGAGAMRESTRLKTLAEVAASCRNAESLSYSIPEFLDEFYAEPLAERVAEEPQLLTELLGDEGLADAYLAGIAEHLSRQYGMKAPAWVFGPGRVLGNPWFAMKSHGGRMCMRSRVRRRFGRGIYSSLLMR